MFFHYIFNSAGVRVYYLFFSLSTDSIVCVNNSNPPKSPWPETTVLISGYYFITFSTVISQSFTTAPDKLPSPSELIDFISQQPKRILLPGIQTVIFSNECPAPKYRQSICSGLRSNVSETVKDVDGTGNLIPLHFSIVIEFTTDSIPILLSCICC